MANHEKKDNLQLINIENIISLLADCNIRVSANDLVKPSVYY